jgi:hypothetical protein
MKTIAVEEAVAMVPDGASLMIGGFMGVGTPERLVDELVRQGKRNLVVIANDTAMPGRGIGKLVGAGLLSRTIASHIGLITLELGPETEVERVQKLFNEVGQERLTGLDRSLIARAKDGILVISAAEEADSVQQTLRVGRLKTLERLGLAKERQQGIWALDAGAERKLRQLGERADKFKMMQRALKEAGIERAAASMALFERGPRKAPLIGKVVGVGLVDEITDRTWVVVDAVDGRVHYAELGRLQPGEIPARGTLVALGGDGLQVKPSVHPRIQVLSPVELERQATYDGPTWLDQAILSKWRSDASARGFAVEVDNAIAARSRWLVAHQLAQATPAGDIALKPDMMRRLRQAETERLAGDLARRLNASYVPAEPGRQIVGVYDRSIATPTGKVAVIRHQDTFTLAPWRPGLETFKGRAVMGMIGPNRVTWSLDRGRGLPGRG